MTDRNTEPPNSPPVPELPDSGPTRVKPADLLSDPDTILIQMVEPPTSSADG